MEEEDENQYFTVKVAVEPTTYMSDYKAYPISLLKEILPDKKVKQPERKVQKPKPELPKVEQPPSLEQLEDVRRQIKEFYQTREFNQHVPLFKKVAWHLNWDWAKAGMEWDKCQLKYYLQKQREENQKYFSARSKAKIYRHPFKVCPLVPEDKEELKKDGEENNEKGEETINEEENNNKEIVKVK